MYSLLLTFIAVGLSLACVAAMIYYGGPAFESYDVPARISALTNQSAQIGAAVQFYTVENGGLPPTALAELKANQYLGAIPSGWLEAPEGSTLISKEVTGSKAYQVCLGFNARYGLEGVPSCAESADRATPVCCQ